MKTKLYNLKNEVVGDLELPNNVFGAPWRPTLVKQVLLAQLANKRKPWAHVKDRGEVRGGGRKPWRQKGTGRARHGSIRSPLWVGGGKAHGPRKERDYSQKINKKMKREAIFSVFSKKLKDGELKFFDDFKIEAPKTKALNETIRQILSLDKKSKKIDLLFISLPGNENLIRAGRNLPKVKIITPESINLYDILNYKNIFIEKEAVQSISKRKRYQ